MIYLKYCRKWCCIYNQYHNSYLKCLVPLTQPGLSVITFMTYRIRSFAYFCWCQFVVGWRKMRYSLTFYFVDFILVWNVSCYICLSCIVWHGISWFELPSKVSMKTTKTGVQRIKMNSQVMYGKEHEQTYHYLQNIHHHLIQPKQNHRRWGSIKTKTFKTKEMISIFPLWTFHLFVATFQQHLHMIWYFRECGSDCCC